ncbi:MAG: SixA phosphatase family protein [Armatimonadaceae bacterium]
MRLLLVRHAEAVDLGGRITRDADRHLTPRGHATAAKLADILRGKVALDAVVCSPFIRAKQTAEPLLALAPAGSTLVECPQLVPMAQDPEGVAETVAGLGGRTVAVVGHLPDLGVFASWLIAGGAVEFDRGTAALVVTDASANQGSGSLRWLVSPDWYE